MHGYRHPAHERRVAELARQVGFTQVSVSHMVSPLMKLVSRGDTTVVDAYLSPILRRYVDRVAAELGGVRLYFMQSNGGLVDAAPLPGQGRDPLRPGGRHRRRRAYGRRWAASTRSSASTWAAPRPTCRIMPANSSAASRPMVAGVRIARADDAHQHRGGGRRLDLRLRRRALSRRPGLGGRGARPGLLSPRRAAHRHRLQSHARQDRSRDSSRMCSGRRATSRSTAPWSRKIRRAGVRDPASHRRQPHRRARSPRASSTSRSRTWPMPSSRSRSSAAMT